MNGMDKSTYDSRLTAYASRESGFTLIELLIVVSLMAIMSAIAIPQLLSVRPGWNVNSATKSILWDMQLARVKAVSNNTKYRIVFRSPSATEYSIQEDTNRNRDWDSTSTDKIIKTVQLPSGIQFGISGGISGPNSATVDTVDGITFTDNYVTFSNEGSANTGTVYLIPAEDLTSGRKDRIRAVRVRFGTTANIKAYRYGGGTSWPDF